VPLKKERRSLFVAVDRNDSGISMERAREPETLSSRSLVSLISWPARRPWGRTVREFNLYGPQARVRERSLPLPLFLSFSFLSFSLSLTLVSYSCTYISARMRAMRVRVRDAAWAARTKAFRRGACGTRKAARKPRNMGMQGGFDFKWREQISLFLYSAD